MMKILMTIIVAVGISLPLAAQQERKFIRGGNDLFDKQNFEKAEVEYRKALDTDVKSYTGAFNLGDALYKQKKYDEALQQFNSLIQNETNKDKLGELYYNMGNTLLSMNKLDESIEAYKQSLRNRPNSQEAKYNLAFARKQKQEQENKDKNDQDKNDQNKDQQNKDQQNKDQQNKDQNKDQQNKDKQDQNKDQQDKNKQDQNKDQNKDQQGGQQPKISKEDAERLLNALEADEKKTQDKVQKEKVQAQKVKKMKVEKNW